MYDACPLGSLEHLMGLGRILGYRLLTDDVLPGCDRRQDMLSMKRGGASYENDVDVATAR
jgi:hypothetical protein